MNIPHSITLMGAEQVQRAANQMQDAADRMQRAAQYFDEIVMRQQRILEEHAEQLRSALSPEKP